MAPAQEKIPGCVSEARKALLGMGLTPDKDSVKKLDKTLMNKVASLYCNAMKPEVMQVYRGLLTHEGRRERIAYYIIVPKTATCNGYNKASGADEDSAKNNAQWLTREQLAGPAFLNFQKHADLI